MQVFSWKDKDSWPNFLGNNLIENADIDENLVSIFYEVYTHIKAYHASRPLEPNHLLEAGIQTANYDELIQQYRLNMEKFCGIKLSDEQIKYAQQEIGDFHNGSLFVVVDDDELLQHAGHYAIYGSEYLLGITNRISHKYEIVGAENLRKFGVPTIFEIELPIEKFTDFDVSCLVREINNYIYSDEIEESIDFTFELCQPIQGSYIVNYYHPNNIADPTNQFKVYVEKTELKKS
ncbi:MAG: hypothetical protein COA96_17375 [SAR86 cluster bacterium]|uniref:Uncharacterized protein n=1 Tax=SAR86 cluster bacterium TaxID=2030880 RepID=A0A2A5AGH0_9GAMM|nr:MAG: hypothetical protein COA96_17375 [SAR86 cluster bacterium]